MGKEVFLILALLLILMPLISAVAPVTSVAIQLNVGLNIDFPKFESIKQGQDFHFHFHVFNISDGVRMDNSTVNCSFELYNNGGEEQLEVENLEYISGDWRILIDGSNFTRIGSYAYLVECHTTDLGGFISFPFEVTPTGTILKTSDSITYFILMGGVLFFFLLCLWGGIVLPFGNQRNDEGKVISVQKLKYFKVGLLFLSYVFFIWVLNLFLALSTSFSILTQYTKLFEVVFSVMNAMSYPLFVFMLVIMSIMGWKDLALKKLLQRGISPK